MAVHRAVRLVNLVAFLLLFIASTCDGQTAPITTVTTPSTTTIPPSTDPPTPIERNTDIAVCTCDLTENACDVNCCCDEDCSSDDRLAFSKCIDEYTPADNQACVRQEIIFKQNTPFTVDVTQPGLFCVEYDNYKDRNYYMIPDPVNDTEAFQELENKYGSYSFQPESTQFQIQTEFYKSGDAILTLYENLSLGFLAQPAAVTNGGCKDLNPAAYLMDGTNQCIRSMSSLAADCMTNSALDASSYFTGFKVIPNPEIFQNFSSNSTNSTDFMTTVAPFLTPAEIQNLYNSSLLLEIIPEGNHTCIDIYGMSYTCNFDVMPSPSYELDGSTGEYYCYNTTVKVTYRMKYNGTTGIIEAGVTFTFRDLGNNQIPLSQSFATEFSQVGEGSTFQRSGNPGYVVSEPVMAGHVVTDTDPQGNLIHAIRLNSGRDNWLTMVKSAITFGEPSTCVNASGDREPVKFGVNMRSGCFVRFHFNNMTELCNLTQWAAWDALRGPNPPTHIASFGNSAVEKVGDWVPILGVDVQPQRSLSGSDPGTCLNVLTGLNIQIVYANVGALDNPQAKCIGPYCMPGNEGLPQSFEIISSVQFIDVSRPAHGASAAIPKVTARLPEDFFYPFS